MITIFQRNRGGALRTIAVLALCAVFFLLAMGITLLGSGIYRNVAAASDENYAHRTSLSYIVNQLRRNDCGEIYLGEFRGLPALMLFERADDPYATLLYCYEGQLMELYTEAEYLDEFGVEDGVAVTGADELILTLQDGLLTISADGRWVSVSPRCQIREVDAL